MRNYVSIIDGLLDMLFAFYMVFVVCIQLTSDPLVSYYGMDCLSFAKVYMLTALERPELYLYLETKTRFFQFLQGAE